MKNDISFTSATNYIRNLYDVSSLFVTKTLVDLAVEQLQQYKYKPHKGCGALNFKHIKNVMRHTCRNSLQTLPLGQPMLLLGVACI